MSLLNDLRHHLTLARNAAAALDARGVQRNLSRLYFLVLDDGFEVDLEGAALLAIEAAQETVINIIEMGDVGRPDGAPQWDEMPDAIDAIEDEIDWD